MTTWECQTCHNDTHQPEKPLQCKWCLGESFECISGQPPEPEKPAKTRAANKRTYAKTCRFCAIEFTATHPSKMECSEKCKREEAEKKRIERLWKDDPYGEIQSSCGKFRGMIDYSGNTD